VQFKMKAAAGGPLLAALSDRAGMMISPTAYKSAGSQDAFNKAPVGSGKFKVNGEWRPVESLSLRTWPGYWDKSTPAIAGMELKDVKVDALVNALNSGQMDLVALDATAQIPGVKNQPNTIVKVDSPLRPQTREFLLNPTVPPLDNLKVRQAIAYALDRDAIADVMTDGEQKGIWQWFPEGWLPFDSALNNTYKYDPAKAKQLLAEAGYPNGLDLKSVIGSSSTSYIQQGELIQAQLKAVGVNMTLDKIDTAQMVPTVLTAGPNKHGTAVTAPWGSNVTADPDEWFRRYFLADGATNNGGDEVPGMRELLDKAAATLDEKTRSDLYRQAQKLVLDGVYEGVPLFFVPGIMAFKDYVGGVVKAETRCPANFLRDVYVTQGKVPATKQK
jgi:ABC-type transport system substrate-binding protein